MENNQKMKVICSQDIKVSDAFIAVSKALSDGLERGHVVDVEDMQLSVAYDTDEKVPTFHVSNIEEHSREEEVDPNKICKDWKNVQCAVYPFCLGCNNCICSVEYALLAANEYFANTPYEVKLKKS